MSRPIIFDLYFTLIEPDPGSAWLQRSAELLGLTPAAFNQASLESFHDRMIGAITTPEEVVDRALVQLGRTVDPATRAALVELRWEFFHTLRLYPDVLPTLEALSQRGHPLALVTNCSAETEHVIERLKLRQFFAALALSSTLGTLKPEPALYQHALDALGADPAQTLFVGDGETEEHRGAKALGMTTILIRRPNGPQRDVATDVVITDLRDLLTLPVLEVR